MNVCMISYSIYDSDARVMRYAETLARRGDRVDVIALSAGDGPPCEIVNGVNVFRIQSRTRKEKSKFSYLFRIILFFVRASLFVARRELKVKYRLVHVHSVPDFLVFAAWLPKLRQAKIILDIHDILPELYASKFGCSEESLMYKVLLGIERWSAAFADHVIVANHIWRDRLISRSVASSKCSVILNFPDRNLFARSGRTRDTKKIVMIYPGSLNWHQGVDIAIRSFARIREQAPNSEFHVYGAGPAQAGLEALANELGLNDRVKFNGARHLTEIVEVMENADVGVVPKRNDPFGDEAFSTKILEFMAMGVPVIVSGTKVDRYYFNDSVVKFFIPGDDSDLAHAMLTLLNSLEQRRALARNATKFVEDYDWDRNKYRYLDIVDRLNFSHKEREKAGTGNDPKLRHSSNAPNPTGPVPPPAEETSKAVERI
jgi:glycosyltransferase involved in cell wall biosynthesis